MPLTGAAGSGEGAAACFRLLQPHQHPLLRSCPCRSATSTGASSWVRLVMPASKTVVLLSPTVQAARCVFLSTDPWTGSVGVGEHAVIIARNRPRLVHRQLEHDAGVGLVALHEGEDAQGHPVGVWGPAPGRPGPGWRPAGSTGRPWRPAESP